MSSLVRAEAPHPESAAAATNEQDTIEVESASSDSGLGTDADTVGSASITSTIYGYKYENGRRYHAYREGSYLLPNDAQEQDRLDLHHHIFRLQLGGALYRAPLPKNIDRVLDLGTGTGIWAIDFADEHPDSLIIGTDLSPIQPEWLPPNCKFYVDDIEADWTWNLPQESFDYIHARGMGGSVADWPRLYQNVLEALKPGAWFEVQEYQAWISSEEDPDMLKAPHVQQWQILVNEAAVKFGKEMNIAHKQKAWLEAAGFEDVHEDIVKIPLGHWAKDPRLKEVGRFQREHMLSCIESYTLAPLVRVLGWRVEEALVLAAGVRSEFSNPKLRLLTIFHFVYGRNPKR